MRKLVFYCDRCKKKIEGNVHKLSDYIIDDDGQLKQEGHAPKELCEDCSRVINFLIVNPVIGESKVDSEIKQSTSESKQVTGKLENGSNSEDKKPSENKSEPESKLKDNQETQAEPKKERKKVNEDRVMELIAQGRSQVSVARELGITQPQVSMIVNKYR